ncbi:MAG: Tar ligand binding domain-containing protein [Thalassobaculum sp.]|uniref:methyl-accepting chemotaxis protein n=1 Tax=Thalassobaculum sp. TaxID=2022740 RepID=UPI0032ED9E75
MFTLIRKLTGTIRARLITLVAVLMAGLVTVGAVGLLTANYSNNRLQTVYADRTVPLGQLAEINNRMAANILALYDAASAGVSGRAVDTAAILRAEEANIAAIGEIWKAYMATTLTVEEAELAKAYQTARATFVKDGLHPAMKLLEAGKYDELDDLVSETAIPLYEIAKPIAEKLMVLQTEVAAREYAAATSTFTTAFLAAIALLVGGIVVGALIALSTIRAISRPLERLIAAMGEIANGNYDNRIEIERRDEIGQALEHLVGMQTKLEETRQEEQRATREKEARASRLTALTSGFDAEISAVLKTVASASTELQSTAASLTATAEQTSQQALAVSAAAEEAGANVQTVASASEELSSSISEIGSQVRQSTDIANRAKDEADQANVRVKGLASAAQQVGEVVTLISDIAAQTNLLALNATIEAARAGEMGKGFAVVAAEVKNLAAQTARATEEISAQIATIQSATTESVHSIEGIAKVIEEVNQISTMIASAVEQQSAATLEIARNVQEAANGTGEVTRNIAGVKQAAGDTGAAASQVLASSSELSQQSESLRAQVERFLSDVKAA